MKIDELQSQEKLKQIEKKNLVIKIPSSHRKLLPIKVKMDLQYPMYEINPMEYQFITKYKNKINDESCLGSI